MTYGIPANPVEFYISEKIATYDKKKLFTVYYDDPEHSIRLLKGGH